MYVIRPQFFIPITSISRNASLESLKYKSQIDLMKRENYDITNFENTLAQFKNIEAKLLIVGFYSDWLYPPERGKEIQLAAMQNNINSSYVVLAGDHGHDSFLFHTDKYSKIIRKFISS